MQMIHGYQIDPKVPLHWYQYMFYNVGLILAKIFANIVYLTEKWMIIYLPGSDYS